MLDINSLKPLPGYVLVKRQKPANSLRSSFLILPDTQRYDSRKCVILATSDNKTLKNGVHFPSELEIGDLVLAHNFDGMKVDPIDQPEYEILDQTLVLALLEKDFDHNEFWGS